MKKVNQYKDTDKIKKKTPYWIKLSFPLLVDAPVKNPLAKIEKTIIRIGRLNNEKLLDERNNKRPVGKKP